MVSHKMFQFALLATVIYNLGVMRYGTDMKVAKYTSSDGPDKIDGHVTPLLKLRYKQNGDEIETAYKTCPKDMFRPNGLFQAKTSSKEDSLQNWCRTVRIVEHMEVVSNWVWLFVAAFSALILSAEDKQMLTWVLCLVLLINFVCYILLAVGNDRFADDIKSEYFKKESASADGYLTLLVFGMLFNLGLGVVAIKEYNDEGSDWSPVAAMENML